MLKAATDAERLHRPDSGPPAEHRSIEREAHLIFTPRRRSDSEEIFLRILAAAGPRFREDPAVC